jgi:uncharacterized membrane protein (DUF4010 family)
MAQMGSDQRKAGQPVTSRRRFAGPAAVGAFFAALAIVLSIAGLWREHNLTLRNAALAIVLGGGTWGLISWAIASAVQQVEEDVASRRDRDGES